jgi:hypothetical protein
MYWITALELAATGRPSTGAFQTFEVGRIWQPPMVCWAAAGEARATPASRARRSVGRMFVGGRLAPLDERAL